MEPHFIITIKGEALAVPSGGSTISYTSDSGFTRVKFATPTGEREVVVDQSYDEAVHRRKESYNGQIKFQCPE